MGAARVRLLVGDRSIRDRAVPSDAGGARGPTGGIVVPETQLIELGELTHFAIRRFDRGMKGEKIHMHSLGGLLHADFNAPGTTSYEQAFRAMLDLGLDSYSPNQWFRRMVFNVAGRNQDDHVKNVSFLMS